MTSTKHAKLDLFDPPEQVKTAPKEKKPRRQKPVEPRQVPDRMSKETGIREAYNELQAAEKLGVARQTLRNWRLGYSNATGTYPPRLTEGKHWFKLRKSRRAPVLYSIEWVEAMISIKHQKQELLP